MPTLSFVQPNKGTAAGPFLYLGAKHTVTALLFLVGVPLNVTSTPSAHRHVLGFHILEGGMD
jgi:hypothetical protein